MANISDIIEEFILSAIGGGDSIEIGRNELANHFLCAPSQINYVLSTRFTVERGYIVDSRRGGGGYIVVARIKDDSINFINSLLEERKALTYSECSQIVDRLLYAGEINMGEADIIRAAVSSKALLSPFNISDSLRASIMREILIKLMMRNN